MKIIFDWISSLYEEKNNWRGDEEIISLKILQKECGFAAARVIVSTKNLKKLFGKKYAKIGIQEQENTDLLFWGRLVSFPIGLGTTTELEFISEPEDYQNKLSEFLNRNLDQYNSLNKHAINDNNFDDLFFSSKDLENPTIFLEGDNKIFHWNMKNGALSLSDINHGQKNFDVSGHQILENSVKVRIAREPYGTVNVKVSASWIQQESGIVDVFPMIAARFDQNMINSFTNIKSGLEGICNFSEKIGYKPIYCRIKEINPNTFAKLYPIVSPDFYIQENETAEKKKIIFKRFYFDGKLILNWSYKQKRIETVNISVLNKSSKHGRKKDLFFTLNTIQSPKKYPIWNYFTYYGCSDKIYYRDSIFECKLSHVSSENFEADKWNFLQKIPDALIDDTSSSFFATPRGQNAARYAIRKAIALINYSSRYIEIDFCVEAKNFISATIDDQITIHDGRFPNGNISGKIIKITFTASADQKIIKFTIGCCTANLSKNFEKLNSYKIEIPEDENKIQPADIVKDIEIKNCPEEQIAALSQTAASNIHDLKKELKATKIKLSLHPINTTRVITREINLPNFEMEEL